MGTLADKLQYLLNTKDAIKQAIIEKGQSILDSDTFRSYADKIKAIQSGGEDTITESVQSSVNMPYEVLTEPAENIGVIIKGSTYSLHNIDAIPDDGIVSDFYTNSSWIYNVYGSTETNCKYYCKFKLDNNALTNSGAIYHIEKVMNIEYNGSEFNAYSWVTGSTMFSKGSATADDWLYMIISVEDNTDGDSYCTKKYYYSVGEGFKLDDEHLVATIKDNRVTNTSQAAIGCSLYNSSGGTFFKGSVDLNETYVTNEDGTEYLMRPYEKDIIIM